MATGDQGSIVPRNGEWKVERQLALLALLSAVGCLWLLISWSLLNGLLWQPYWRELRDLGFYTHDVGAGFLIALGTPVMTCLIFLGGLAEAITRSISRKASTIRSVALFAGLPSVLMVYNWFVFRQSSWDYPLAGVPVLLIAALLGLAYDRLAVQDLSRLGPS
jgi:hypothetical protein